VNRLFTGYSWLLPFRYQRRDVSVDYRDLNLWQSGHDLSDKMDKLREETSDIRPDHENGGLCKTLTKGGRPQA
jgi:uncharacterized protein CbrC (UPF0167 family)